MARIYSGQRPAFAEYDLLHGLTGIGAYLLKHIPGGGALGRILAYLVRLTEPLHADDPIAATEPVRAMVRSVGQPGANLARDLSRGRF